MHWVTAMLRCNRDDTFKVMLPQQNLHEHEGILYNECDMI